VVLKGRELLAGQANTMLLGTFTLELAFERTRPLRGIKTMHMGI
jgi:hypothetical protein